jgi:hypothetical protein
MPSFVPLLSYGNPNAGVVFFFSSTGKVLSFFLASFSSTPAFVK